MDDYGRTLVSAKRAGKPTYFFEVGDKVKVGSLLDPVVDEVLDNGLCYRIKFREQDKKKYGEEGGNTKIFYLYIDGSNYKVHNEAVVKGTITKEQANEIFDCTYAGSFIPGDVGLPENRFDDYSSDDTDWFELHNPEEAFFATAEEPTVDMTVDELVARFASMRDQWKKQWEL